MENKPKIVFITPHYLQQYRRTGFFWMADAFHKKGWSVLFFTSPISLISIINRDNRFRFPVWAERQKLIEKKPYLYSFVHFTLLHKVDLKKVVKHSIVANFIGSILNKILSPICTLTHLRLRQSKGFIQSANAFVFESSPSLELLEHFIKLSPKATLIYRVSDDLRLLRVHPDTYRYERANLHRFHRVSVQSSALLDTIKSRDSNCAAVVDLHGVNKTLFDACQSSPYTDNNKINAIFIGIGDVDYHCLNTAVKLKPEWHFHIIGPLKTIIGENVTNYGELPFEETIPYVKYADIGFNCRTYTIGAESFTDTLKILQYSYCGLAIVAPEFLKTERPNTFYYQPNHSESILSALNQAEKYDRKKDTYDYAIQSWDEISQQWIKELNLPKK